MFGLLGPNGSGKTTALRLLLGFLRPTAGHAWIAGHECWHDSLAVRRRVAYLPGELRLYENMTGRQLIHFLGRLREQPVRDELDDPRAPLRHRSRSAAGPSVLRHETQGRAVASAAAANAAGHHGRADQRASIRSCATNCWDRCARPINAAKRCLFSSHVLSEVEEVCDRVAILHRGRLAHMQIMSELREGRLVRARFRGDRPALPPLAGLAMRDAAERLADPGVHGAVAALVVLAGLLSRSADLRYEPLGIKAIYHRYHGGDDEEA